MFLHILFLQNMWIFLPLFPLFSMHLCYAILVDRNVGEKPFFLNRCLRIAPQEGSYFAEKYTFTSSFFQQHDMTVSTILSITICYRPAENTSSFYLCLLRHAADYGSIPLESIANFFDYTERDLPRPAVLQTGG